jgi:ribosome biogenesis GTPase / thiamine phosphate phosphatase
MPEGIVIRSTGSWYTVFADDGQTVLCRLRGQYRLKGVRTTNPLAVGDRVTFRIEPDQATAIISEIHDRHNLIIRKATRLSKAAHIIAANLDQAVLVATIDHPRTSSGFIDRFLVTAEAYHIPAAIVFNKLDIYSSKNIETLNRLMDLYGGIGYGVLKVSAIEGTNLDGFIALLSGKVSLLTGHSGVGKSALINTIDQNLKLRTAEISTFSNKGKHTTTFAEMHPLAFGGWIVDTPGIKEFGLYDFEADTLAQRFPEMRERMPDCRFANCTHLHEPGCAVKKAFESGAISPTRYKNYLNMLRNDFTDDN